MIGEVGQLLARAGFGGYPSAAPGQQLGERVDEGSGALLPDGAAQLGTVAPDLGLDGVDLGDAAQALVGDGRCVAVE